MDPIDLYNRALHRDTLLEAYRLLLQEALRIESDSQDICVHYGTPPEGNIVDPIPIEDWEGRGSTLDITITSEFISSPETVLLVYQKCREAMGEFSWGRVDEHSP